MIDTEGQPYNPYKRLYERHTELMAFHAEQVMAALNEIDVMNERKIVEFDLDSIQGNAKVTLVWTPKPGTSGAEVMK